MMGKSRQQITTERLYPCQILDDLPDDLGMVIALPCYREQSVLPMLESLARCTAPDISVEVILVILTSDQDKEEVMQENQHTYWEAESWYKAESDLPFALHILHFQGVPHEIMGVDLTRKIGMEEGATRLMAARQPQGILAMLDADAEVPRHYLQTLAREYQSEPELVGLTTSVTLNMSSRHSEEELQLIQWVALEALYLRQGSLQAGYHLAQYHQASGISCRAWAYRQCDGIPVGDGTGTEVFWQRLALLGLVSHQPNLTVSVTPRFNDSHISGLGKRLSHLKEQGPTSYKVVGPAAFEALKAVMDFGKELPTLHSMHEFQRALRDLHYQARGFLIEEQVGQLWRQWHSRGQSPANGWSAWLQWFDRERWKRAIRFWGQESFAKVPIEEAVASWLQEVTGWDEESLDLGYLLSRMEHFDPESKPAILKRA